MTVVLLYYKKLGAFMSVVMKHYECLVILDRCRLETKCCLFWKLLSQMPSPHFVESEGG